MVQLFNISTRRSATGGFGKTTGRRVSGNGPLLPDTYEILCYLTVGRPVVTTQHHLNILFNEQQNESPAARNLTNLFKISQISCFFVRFGQIYSISVPNGTLNLRVLSILEQQGHGHLVAITSVGGLRGEPMAPAYSASKAYQINYMEALRKKAFKNGGHIIVTDIRPGLVDTAMAKGEGLFWVMPVEKVARQIISAIRKKKSKAYVTRRWHILAIINKNLPFFLYKRL